MIRKKEKLVEIKSIPQSSVGAPCPLVFATEHEVVVTYFLNEVDPDWDGSSVRVISPGSSEEPSITIKFERVLAHYFGMPNDEAISGHPLSDLGIEPYSYYEVKNSSWIEKHEKMNRVHPYHKKKHYSDYRHFIFTFHDTTFEVIAKGYSTTKGIGSLTENILKAIKTET